MLSPDRCRSLSILLILTGFILPVRADSAPQAAASFADAKRLLDTNDLAGARRSAESAVAAEPSSVDAHYLLGVVAERQNDLKQALASYDDALRLSPKRADVEDRRGFVLGRLGRTA